MRIKKELLEIALVFLIGVIFVLLLALNVQKYNKNHPIESQYGNIEINS